MKYVGSLFFCGILCYTYFAASKAAGTAHGRRFGFALP